MASWRRIEPNPVLYRAALGIVAAKIEPADAGEGDRRRAHRARFERDIDIGIDEAFAAQRPGRGPDRQQFGVRGGVGELQSAISLARENHSVLDDNRADGYLPATCCGTCLLQRQFHNRALHLVARRLFC
jgi:hypothetical protein